jgi:Ca2+-binding RTX toxin-like protein
MSSSLIGGSYDTLSTGAQAVIDAVMGDTIGGQVTSTTVGSGTLVVGSGTNGETQGVFVGAQGSAIAGEVNAGGVSLTVALPPSVNMAFQGPSAPVTNAEAVVYAQAMLSQVAGLSESESSSLTQALHALIDTLTGGDAGATVSLRFVVLTDTSTGSRAGEIVSFNGGNNAGDEALVFAMSQVSNKVLSLTNVKAALLIGDGTVKVNDYLSASIRGDSSNQNITGGAGRDTLVGGGGQDTLTGGSGADVFGVSVLGNLTITDFNVSQDKLAFTLPGVTNLETLAPLFSGLTVVNGNSVLGFGAAGSVTLVGVNPSELTIDLIKFTL